MNLVTYGVPAAIVAVIILLVAGIVTMWKKVPQDKAYIVTGLKKRVISGGGGLVIPLLERYDMISLENMKIDVRTERALTEQGVDIIVDGVTVIKVKSDQASIYSAVEQFNTGNESNTVDFIKSTAKDVLEGKLREIISKMTVEEIHKDREKFASQVQEVAAVDLAGMGLEIKAFTIKDISDSNGYLQALGKKRIAEVKRDAEISEAKATSETKIQTAEAQKNSKIETSKAFKFGEQARLEAETEISEFAKEKELKVQAYRKEQETEKAKADLAYEIEQNKVKKEVTETEMAVELLKKEREIQLAEREAAKKERELEASVKKQAEAKKYKDIQEAEARAQAMKLESEAKRYKDIQEAEARAQAIRLEGEAKAEAIRLEGQAEASIIEEKGKAEAEAMFQKAEAFKQYNEAAVIQMLVEKLPEIANSISAPLAKTEKIVIVDNGGDGNNTGAAKVSNYVTTMMSQLPETIEATTGINLLNLLKNKVSTDDAIEEAITEDSFNEE
ncbi:flotillin family protein [Anaeromicrobium sediminis]|uniref:Flotillin n=1 Tax=Anaeromicrobium sediminis TaxID=1478221 RepID=A0A267MLM2_9FIRM|nr:flotillin family protein [Anaeromicrobium sediminis]PAB60436.1 flotillin [Anaeromicrobium sediminis]